MLYATSGGPFSMVSPMCDTVAVLLIGVLMIIFVGAVWRITWENGP